MARLLHIDNRVISDRSDCYVIAEIGHNHQGNLNTAREMFLAAKESGASAVKLQKRDNRRLYTKSFYDKPYENENSFGDTYGKHRDALEFGKSEYRELVAYSQEIGITMFATAFDLYSADFLAELDMPAYKIASGDLNNIPLLRHVADLGKPMIVSTGGGTVDDIRRMYDEVMPRNPQLAILQCTAGYPCAFEEMNLRVLTTMRRHFPDVVVGLSAHDNGIAMSLVAFALGARIVEKHFTLNRAMKGTDHAFSLERTGMQKLVRDLRRARQALGDGRKQTYLSERSPLHKMGKKLVAARPLPAGHVITPADIAIKSPADGLPPYYFDQIVGAVTLRPLHEDDNLDAAHVQIAPDAPTIRAAEPPLEESLAGLRLVAFDFDGVFTDNHVVVLDDGHEAVRCTRADGLGLSRLAEVGVATMVISTETNPVVAARCRKLGIKCISGCDDKRAALEAEAERLGISLLEVAFVGNDANDRAALSSVGVPIVVRDAHPSVAALSRYRTKRRGGRGAVREVCELIAMAKHGAAAAVPRRRAEAA